ncbi:MAG: D-alanine--poly(phosphoribitol) ligase subunit DltA [Enterococcus italicus]|jgi:D-alanine--poly(phosphoribitol) ligase subunit 1|uniref:D-alanine--poly(phosphoribitol) ligase subunit DltA n=1 Tax=Enterococcus italicus TaxID=246144 RepID=UPI000ED7F2A1|nr:D-alanine--poly(phosphoribitol) ligase subunit DltA [Enterococcus italicus]MCM6932321.1 D-alanine--poly(phosphoribitol) ligase subunit DltA [Enterococcus italicus]HCS30029.1 D-alanine--poly(phosphoribitol) ligase subunit 1 [Enterococcus sp.]
MRYIYEEIDKIATKQPNAKVYIGKTTHTYCELKKQSDQLARYFAANVAQSEPIVVYGGQEFGMIVAFLAAMKSGHPYIPIETHTPQERLAYIVDIAKPALCVWTSECPMELPCSTVSLEQLMTESLKQEAVVPKGLALDETVYIIFTSGTTGVPKGVQISQQNLWSFVQWALQDLGIHKEDRFLSQAPFSFDLSVMSVYPALLIGGALVPLAKETVDDFKELFSVLPKLPIDVWVSTPSFIDICLMEPAFSHNELPSLRVFLFCGEELTKETAKKLLQKFPEAMIYNTYGPTEATVAVSQIQVTTELLEAVNRLPIGYVKEDTKVTIMHGNQVVVGETGEIVLSGPSISKGYVNNPSKTAAAFFTLNGEPAYRTGDAGKVIDGLLYYEGRIDFQVKLHGYRIELEEIDHHLMAIEGIKQAIVVPKYNQHKVQQLLAYVVMETTETKDYERAKMIRQELKKTVMPYMIPQKYVFCEQLPRTANGKLDRKRLIQEVNPT